MLYKNLDFDADKVGLYREVRMAMAELYKDDEQYFGSVIVDIEKEKESKELIKRGTKRIQEKLKEIRQHFSKAVVSGSRSGSGKIVFEFYDQLILLWGGSANIEPLEFGVKGDDFIVEDSNNIESYDEETVLSSEVSPNNSMESTSRISTSGESNDDLFITPKPNKRKHSSNSVESNESEDACPSNKKRDRNLLIINEKIWKGICLLLSETSCYLKRLEMTRNFEKIWPMQCESRQNVLPKVLMLLVNQ